MILKFLLCVLGLAVAVWAVCLGYLWWWLKRETGEDRYFARTLSERRALRAAIARRAPLFIRLVRWPARWLRLRPPSGHYRGVAFPAIPCPPRAFRASVRFQPDARDIIVATQMKCGTTWMQQIVFQILTKGQGDLGDPGYRHMYALSPWLESSASVPLDRAPRLGDDGYRLIKTHHNADLCPYSTAARYIYVARHPASCFASMVDFLRKLAGPTTWTLPEFLDMFCSDEMYWGHWPGHVAGWWRRAQASPNVLFLHFESMLADLPGTVAQVADFIGVTLSAEQLAEVVRKSGYQYMRTHEEVFEMSPPSFFSVQGGDFFASGKGDRYADVGDAERARITAFCRGKLDGADYPLAHFYPDVAGTNPDNSRAVL